MNHVVTLVGGIYETRKTTDQDGMVYEVVSPERQQQAMVFLDEHVFQTPEWLLDESILRRIEPAGAVDRIRGRQVGILNNLLHPSRLQRLIEAEAIDGADTYSALVFMQDLKASIWEELADRRPAIDTYRRNLQRGYLERLEYLMTEEFSSNFAFFFGTTVDVSQSDIRPLVRGILADLQTEIGTATSRTRDAMTRFHLQDATARIEAMLSGD